MFEKPTEKLAVCFCYSTNKQDLTPAEATTWLQTLAAVQWPDLLSNSQEQDITKYMFGNRLKPGIVLTREHPTTEQFTSVPLAFQFNVLNKLSKIHEMVQREQSTQKHR
jgi:hypothetical protein